MDCFFSPEGEHSAQSGALGATLTAAHVEAIVLRMLSGIGQQGSLRARAGAF